MVALTALNVDVIAPASVMRQLENDAFRESAIAFDQNTERPANLSELQAILTALQERIGADALRSSLGGSGFAMIVALARMGLGLRLGVVGVAGRTSAYKKTSFFDEMDRWGIDSSFVCSHDGDAGVCVSLATNGKRTLRTCPQANDEFSEFIRRRHTELVKYLSRSRVVHVTSFLDEHSAVAISDLLTDVKLENDLVRVSFDPGYAWCADPPPGFDRLLHMTDYLLLNYDEFRLLADAEIASDLERAQTIISGCSARGVVIVLKHYDKISIYSRDPHGSRVGETSFSHAPLTPPEVEDATGAGDAFAAGLIAGLTSRRLQAELGSMLGMVLARAKLPYVGTSGHHKFEPIASNFLKSLESELLDGHSSRRVFVSHGPNPAWKDMVDFLQDGCGIQLEYFEGRSRHGATVPELVLSMIRQCGAAVILLLGEDEVIAPRRAWKHFRRQRLRVPRQNVVHELGMAQSVLPPNRIFVLTENDVVLPSNLQGIVTIRFQRGEIVKTFGELRGALKDRGLLPGSGLEEDIS